MQNPSMPGLHPAQQRTEPGAIRHVLLVRGTELPSLLGTLAAAAPTDAAHSASWQLFDDLGVVAPLRYIQGRLRETGRAELPGFAGGPPWLAYRQFELTCLGTDPLSEAAWANSLATEPALGVFFSTPGTLWYAAPDARLGLSWPALTGADEALQYQYTLRWHAAASPVPYTLPGTYLG